MAVLPVQMKRNLSSVTSRGSSPALWADCHWNDMAEKGTGIAIFEDFLSGGLLTVPTTAAAFVGIPYTGFSSSASQIAYGNPTQTVADSAYGTVTLAETTTRESTSIRSDVVPFRISSTFGKLWFEARLKINTVATNEISFFVGLFEDETLTVDIPVIAAGADTHLIADKNCVGFKKPVADTTTIDGIYRADGQTAVVANDGTMTIAADTYFKVGLKFDPKDPNNSFSPTLSYYFNNQIQATKVTVPDNTGTSFPADVPLGWVVGMSVGTAASDNTLTLDWIRCAQEING